jgi:hypothetical protein
LALVEGPLLSPQQLELACAITARYSKGRDADSVELLCSNREQDSKMIQVKPLTAEQIRSDWVLT